MLLATASAVVAGLLAAPVSTPAEAAAPVHAPAQAPQTKPNIVLITTDDQTVSDLRHMPYTRSLLGAEGTTFNDAVSPFPLCCPARATLMTGQHAHNHGVLSNVAPHGGYQKLRPLNPQTLPNWLQRAGYRTVFAGKYLNGYGYGDKTEVPAGWDDWNGAVDGVYNYWGTSVNHNGEVIDQTGRYIADLTQDVTERTIEQGESSNQPFFVWQSNLAPHGACHPKVYDQGCRWSWPMPDDEDENRFTALPLNTQRHPAFNERVVADKPSFVEGLETFSPERVQRLANGHRYRVRSLQAVDRNVRDTVEQLRATDQLDETLIIFSSDNGYLQGQHRWNGKTLPYEDSLRIPMLMRGPGVPAGATVSETTSLVDIPATIADVAGAEPMLKLDGQSLVDVANGAPGYGAIAIEAGSVFDAIEGGYFYTGVRTRRYTYLEYPQTGERELYDRKRDPGQTVNVAYRPTHRDTRRALAEMLTRLRGCAGEECRTVSGRVPAPEPAQGPVHPDELAAGADATQLVTVTGRDWSSRRGTAVAWEKRGDSWRRVRGPLEVQLGRRGMAVTELGGLPRGKTAAGAFDIERAFGIRPDPETVLPYRQVDKDDRWAYDPEAPRTFNVLQLSRSDRATWRERLERVFWDYRGRFQYGAVLDHNLPSQIFWDPTLRQRMARMPADVRDGSLLLHTGDRLSGHGWVTMPTRDLRWLLRWVSASTGDAKVVVGTPGYLREHL